MNQKQRTIGFFSCIAVLVIFGTCLIVSSCKNDAPATQPQARLTPGAYQQYDQLSPQQQQAPTVVYEQAPPQEDHFWRDMYIWNAMFGSRQTVVVQQPAYRPVYHPLPMQYPAPVVNKTVQNITINQPVNHAPPSAPVVAAAQAAKPAAVSTPNFAPSAPPAPSAQAKSNWWASPAQVVKASTNYPKASNSNSGSYGMKSNYGSYSQKSSYSSGSYGRRK
jgi:hypothetical protein